MNNSQRISLRKIPVMQLSNIQEVSGNMFQAEDRGSPPCDCPPPSPTSPLPVTNAAFQRCLERLSPTWCPALFRHSVRHRLCHNPSLGVTCVCVSACVCFLSFGSAFGEDEKCESCMKKIKCHPDPLDIKNQIQTPNCKQPISRVLFKHYFP